MNLIERYAQAVGRHLPAGQRKDIEAEIRSMIADMLDERSQQAGRSIDDELTRAVLKELGDPEKVAASYQPARYLIGPRLYPFFALVIRIVFTVLTAVLLLGLLVRIATGDLVGGSIFQTGADTFAGLLSGLIAAFGNVVLVFAMLERVIPAAEFEKKPEWTPEELTREPDPDAISRWELIIGTFFTIAAIVIFNFYPRLIGFTFIHEEEWVFLPVLSAAFFRVLPLMNLEWILQIGLNLALLRIDRWDVRLRWISLGVQLVGLVVAALLLSGPSIIGLNTADLAQLGVPSDSATTVVGIIRQGVKVALAIALGLGAVEFIRTLARILRKPAASQQLA